MDIGHSEGMPTVGMWVDSPVELSRGDVATVQCRVMVPSEVDHLVYEGAEFKLWDGAFFANGTVTKRFEAEWMDESDGHDV